MDRLSIRKPRECPYGLRRTHRWSVTYVRDIFSIKYPHSRVCRKCGRTDSWQWVGELSAKCWVNVWSGR